MIPRRPGGEIPKQICVCYRVSVRNAQSGEHLGFRWFTDQREAGRYRDAEVDIRNEAVVERFEFGRSKAQLVRMLNLVAEHPDNG